MAHIISVISMITYDPTNNHYLMLYPSNILITIEIEKVTNDLDATPKLTTSEAANS